MAFQVSPGIYTQEKEYVARSVRSTTPAAAIAGIFNDGPVDNPKLINSEVELLKVFGPPSDDNFETWYTAANFLSYSNALWVNRVVQSTTLNATTTGTPGLYKTEEDALANTTIGALIARSPGAIGNKLKISICPNANAFSSTDGSISGITMTVGATFATITDYAELAAGDILQVVDTKNRKYDLMVTDASTSNVQFSNAYAGRSNLTSATGTRKWGYYKASDFKPPKENRVHIVVIDEDGGYTGSSKPGDILEIFNNVSVVAGTSNREGNNIYYKDIINNGIGRVNLQNKPYPSPYLYATGATISTVGSAIYASLSGGVGVDANERNVDFDELTAGYDVFANKNQYNIRYILQGKARGGSGQQGLANYIIRNICEKRKDCVLFITPSRNSVTRPYIDSTDDAVKVLTDFRNLIDSSSYAVLDSGYKMCQDVYNNKVNRWVPMNGDIAGLVARTAVDNDPWYSPAGYNRGKIKNVVKLAFNPNEQDRDTLYPNEINPVIRQVGEGTLLFGDKTLLGDDDSAFNHINVRMLFITIEKAIENASKSSLFEFNDAFTRAQFKNIVEPYLRDIQGRRGIYDFKVVCDESNNTPEVIDNNTFIGDIYIKPARSINYIKLNFVSVPTGTSFNVITGNS